MSKILVTYFSASGVTRNVANELAKAAQADVYEIKPATPYTAADLDWKDKESRSTLEMKDLSSRPELADTAAKVADYDTVFVGYPIWWHTAPTIINTFLEAYDFAGKTIILFATSGSGGFGDSVENLKVSVSDTTVIKEGRILNGAPSADELKDWVNSLGL